MVHIYGRLSVVIKYRWEKVNQLLLNRELVLDPRTGYLDPESLVFQNFIGLRAVVRDFYMTAELLEHPLSNLLIDQIVLNHKDVTF